MSIRFQGWSIVLKEIVIGELNKLLATVRDNEDEQKNLKATVGELTAYIETAEQKSLMQLLSSRW